MPEDGLNSSFPKGAARPDLPTAPDLIEIAENMEQGVVVWDDDARCCFFTGRVIEILGMRKSDLHIGLARDAFFKLGALRQKMTDDDMETIRRRFEHRHPFQFDLSLRSGHIVSTRARPFGENRFVVTFTDVTRERQQALERDADMQSADDARRELAVSLQNQQSAQYEAQLINDFADWLQTCKSLDELYGIVKEYLSRVLRGSNGELYVYSNSRDVLDGALSWGKVELQSHMQPDACWGLRRGRHYRYTKAEICFECAHVRAVKHVPIHEYTCIPIIAHGDTVGLMHIRYSATGEGDPQIKDPLAFAVKCGELISMAIANVRLRDELHEQSTRDPLTGLGNRRACLDMMRQEVQNYARTEQPFSVISFDADKFKSFNDNFGHDAGDSILLAIADTMKVERVKGQFSSRLGGEEFLLALPDTDLAAAKDIAEMLRKDVEALRVTYANQPLPSVTISCGVATFPEHGTHIQDVLKAADCALYLAKDGGRNMVVTASGAVDGQKNG